ncbi:hypothetical protein [Flagellimonas marina]|jgi:hypothetical protein|uniref:Right handed beta helix region n=1 Tax=Flagellimonas marina TaxID=1775168 RepID=A0ABV8PPH0_9FLAO
MNFRNPTSKYSMLILFFTILTFFSCAKDSDLFLDAILEEEEVVETDDEIPTDEPEDDVEEDEEVDPTPDDDSDKDPEIPDVQIPDFGSDAGNSISLAPSNPNRIIYVAVDGSSNNDGLSQSSPINIDKAFDSNFVKAGDVFYIKAGKYNYGSTGGNHYDLSNLPCTPNDPCYWIGYKNTPGDINASQYATVSWDDYKTGAQNSDGTHDLDPSDMPTFSGSKSSGKYIDNGSLFYCDGGEQGFVFRNIQIEYFRRGFDMRNLSNSIFENVVQANHGWFTEVEGQGGSNTDLQGTGWLIYSTSTSSWGSNNIILNCASYNMAFRGFTIGNSRLTLVAFSEATSDIDNGNPQDYYFHTIGKDNLFTNLKANRLVSSNHSGHGICFNQLSENNIMQDSEIYGTNIHFDGSIGCYANNITVIGDNSFGLFEGGGISMIDGAEYNLIENCTLTNGGSGVSFSDSGKNPYEEHAGQNNVFRNLNISNKSGAIISLNWWAESDDPCSNNSFQNCTFSNASSLFSIARTNSNFSIVDCDVSNVAELEVLDDRNGNYILNSNTQFIDSNFWNSELPSAARFIVDGLTSISN